MPVTLRAHLLSAFQVALSCFVVPYMLAVVVACAGARTPEGQRELTRNLIHERHSACMQRAEQYGRAHGVDAMAFFWCDAQANHECADAGLETECSQWQGGGI